MAHSPGGGPLPWPLSKLWFGFVFQREAGEGVEGQEEESPRQRPESTSPVRRNLMSISYLPRTWWVIRWKRRQILQEQLPCARHYDAGNRRRGLHGWRSEGLTCPEYRQAEPGLHTHVSGPKAHLHLCMFSLTASSEEGSNTLWLLWWLFYLHKSFWSGHFSAKKFVPSWKSILD